MNWATNLSRDELLLNLEAFRNDKDFLELRDSYLKKAVHSLDFELTEALLKIGANPDASESWGDGLLHYLAHEYGVTKTIKGAEIIQMLETLLKHGANPNHVGCNNWRAIDSCIDINEQTLIELFIKHGADPKQREFV